MRTDFHFGWMDGLYMKIEWEYIHTQADKKNACNLQMQCSETGVLELVFFLFFFTFYFLAWVIFEM